MSRLETERLILHMFREVDFEQYATMMCDAEVSRYLGDWQIASDESILDSLKVKT